jgi:hypothetical protein
MAIIISMTCIRDQQVNRLRVRAQVVADLHWQPPTSSSTRQTAFTDSARYTAHLSDHTGSQLSDQTLASLRKQHRAGTTLQGRACPDRATNRALTVP